MTQERMGTFNFWYPNVIDFTRPQHYPNEAHPDDHEVTHCRIGLMNVRCADDLIVSYDFERDGWKIEQETGVLDENDDFERVEVAFIRAWGSNKTGV